MLHDQTLYAGKQAGFEAAAARRGASGRTDVCAAHRLPSVTHAVHIWPFEQIFVLIFRQDSLCVGLRRAAGELLVAVGEVLLRSIAAA